MQGTHVFDPRARTAIDLESFVEEGHLLRKVHRILQLSFVRELTAASYASGMGRPSIDPEVYFRMLLVAYLYPESVNFFGGVAGKRACSCGDIVNDGPSSLAERDSGLDVSSGPFHSPFTRHRPVVLAKQSVAWDMGASVRAVHRSGVSDHAVVGGLWMRQLACSGVKSWGCPVVMASGVPP
jgi:hypothetical protein